MTKRVLLVEDDRDIRENLALFIELEGYDVDAAANGEQALELLRDGRELPSVILLDLMMPILDGFGFREQQLKDPKLAALPVILMTAHGKAQAHVEKIGAIALLRKPLDIEELSELLARV